MMDSLIKSCRIESGPSGLVSLFCFFVGDLSLWCEPLWLVLQWAIGFIKMFLFWSLFWFCIWFLNAIFTWQKYFSKSMVQISGVCGGFR